MLIERLAARLTLAADPAPAPGRRRAAVAVVLREDRVLMMQRAVRTGDPWSGHISLPGGGYHPSDRSMLATAIRETHEELGIELAGARLLGSLAPLHPRISGPRRAEDLSEAPARPAAAAPVESRDGIEVTPFVFATSVAIEPRCGPEAVAAFWLPLELAAGGSLDGTYTYPGSGTAFPSWTWEGHVIWGLTLRIIRDLMAYTTP